MPTPPTDFQSAFKFSEPPIGQSQPSLASTLFVLNTNAKTATTTPTNVQEILAGTAADAANIRVVTHPRMYTLLNIGLALYRADRSVSLSGITAPVVNVFGLREDPLAGHRLWPPNEDSSFAEPAAGTLGIWTSISTYGHTLGTVGVTLDTTICAIQYSAASASGADWSLTDFVPLPLDGAKKLLVSISTALVVTGASKAMVVGYFSTPSA